MFNKISNLDKELAQDVPRSKKVHSVAALFDTPDEIIHAARETSNAGYDKYDVYTPYPVHGMDAAMRMKDTIIGKFAFLAGLTGVTLAVSMIYYMSGVDYKNIIGGKPFFNLPASIPIMFELTVLISGLFCVFGMLLLWNKLPQISNPLHDTNFMKFVSSTRFGVAIESEDAQFDVETAKAFLAGVGGKEIEVVYYPEENIEKKTPIFEGKFIVTLIVVAIVTALGTYGAIGKLVNVLPFDWMHKQFKVNPQQTSTLFKDGRSMQRPVDGTVARGYMPYEYAGMPDSLVKLLSNPVAMNEKSIERGKKQFNTYCSPCHGYFGAGDSRLNNQFPNPPTLHSKKVREWADGNIYHVITNGQNVMPSYAKQISRDDRWAIINYIRVLQRAENAKDTDLP
jgi:mono/diheme cytochrome c family protein